MANSRPFASEHVITEQVNLPELRGYHIGFEQRQFRLQPLVDIIRSVIPEYALGYYQGTTVTMQQMIERAKDAALTLYNTPNFKRRGEFGELILHLLLREFFNTIPLISTIYFRDAVNVPAHGFDGVHVIDTPGNEKLFLGESKLYKEGSDGIRDLIGDMKKHLQVDYLREQFNLVTRKIPHGYSNADHWQKLLHKHNKLEAIFKKLIIPMVCTYNSPLFTEHNDETPTYFQDFEAECQELFAQFQRGKTRTDIEFVLLLLPVPCKDMLNQALHQRLVHMQQM